LGPVSYGGQRDFDYYQVNFNALKDIIKPLIEIDGESYSPEEMDQFTFQFS